MALIQAELQEVLAALVETVHKRSLMPKTPPKKAKRGSSIVMYVRVRPEEHARVVKLVEQRGYPHTIASVAAEMISRGLASEAPAPPAKGT